MLQNNHEINKTIIVIIFLENIIQTRDIISII